MPSGAGASVLYVPRATRTSLLRAVVCGTGGTGQLAPGRHHGTHAVRTPAVPHVPRTVAPQVMRCGVITSVPWQPSFWQALWRPFGGPLAGYLAGSLAGSCTGSFTGPSRAYHRPFTGPFHRTLRRGLLTCRTGRTCRTCHSLSSSSSVKGRTVAPQRLARPSWLPLGRPFWLPLGRPFWQAFDGPGPVPFFPLFLFHRRHLPHDSLELEAELELGDLVARDGRGVGGADARRRAPRDPRDA